MEFSTIVKNKEGRKLNLNAHPTRVFQETIRKLKLGHRVKIEGAQKQVQVSGWTH